MIAQECLKARRIVKQCSGMQVLPFAVAVKHDPPPAGWIKFSVRLHRHEVDGRGTTDEILRFNLLSNLRFVFVGNVGLSGLERVILPELLLTGADGFTVAL